MSVCLLERNDLGFGASGNSSGMIHGGLRYLSSNPKVTRLSCLDSGFIQNAAPHLLFRIPFLMPFDQRAGSRVWMQLVDAALGAYDRYQPLKRGKPHTRLSADEVRSIEPGLTGDLLGALTFDEWGIDGGRLCAANALDAHAHGADVRVHVSAEAILRDESSGAVIGVAWRDLLDGSCGTVRARVVVNATGAWSPITASLAGLAPESSRVRPGKGIHVVFDRRLSNYAIATMSIDHRQVFLEPWENVSVLGTTDTDYYGDLDDVQATSDEVRSLIQAIARVFPTIREARIIGTFAGVRPTLYEYGAIPDKLSREHEIVDHARHGANGLFSMIGGKLASYRIFAEEMSDIVATKLGVSSACATRTSPLPGGDRTLDAKTFAAEHQLPHVAARRLIYRHGSRAIEIGEMMRSTPHGRDFVCHCEAITEAELRFVVRNEFVRTVDDVVRRTRLALGPCGGLRCVMHTGLLVAQELELSPREGLAQAMASARRLARNRTVGLGPAQARQEALTLAAWRSHFGLGTMDSP